ncbi:hypothetical protein PRIPAC_72843 [Pristionchus pacificus]|uniref:Uncharacterized protein n=1 Tax=Pristionchus pacificus TaxID=54126 RepID=A0A2A6CAL4_PRIPA|nr:hypothetical protein PRIPAC_72843 [Pristionchus pacificus]|eukprot:PDM75093.1 hypothetical protein PRIPAC_40474 [Pristionchus pacificus]
MTPTFFLLFALISAVLGNTPCIDYSAVCVPAQAMERGCHCALIRPGQEEAARQSLRQMFGRTKRDVYDDIRFAILGQNGTNELNRFFSTAESVPAGVDNNVFANINTQVHSSLMTVPKNLVRDVINMQGNWLSSEAQNQLLNCGGPRCEVVGQITDLLGNSAPTRQDRKFRTARAVRYDMDGDDTLIAFSSAVSDFLLNKKTIQWEERKCKRRWLGLVKKCRKEPRSREELREFDEVTRNNWMNHVNREMVGKFRINNANLLV